MAKKKKEIPQYPTTIINGQLYYRTRIEDTDGKRVSIYAKTAEELYDKVQNAVEQIQQHKYNRENPTIQAYCEEWINIYSHKVGNATMVGYASKIRNYIIDPIGNMRLTDVRLNDIERILVPVRQLSESFYHTTVMLLKMIFESAVDNNIIDVSPCNKLSSKGGVPKKDKQSLSDEQAEKLLSATKGLPPYVFIMIGLYAGLRREEILALQWDCVFLNSKSPYISVQRAWRSVNNRPVISDILKTDSSRRNIPIPDPLYKCLKEAKKASKSNYVVSNQDGEPLSYTQYQRLWKYVSTRTAEPRKYTKYQKGGNKTVHYVNPVLGERADHNPNVVYSLDFHVTPHQLRHTYITNLISASVDPKTVQYLAGHKNSKMTMDVYAKVKYNKPEDLIDTINTAFCGKNDD